MKTLNVLANDRKRERKSWFDLRKAFPFTKHVCVPKPKGRFSHIQET